MHHTNAHSVDLRGTLGVSGDCKVLLGFAPARLLASISFADVLDEETGIGYQRRFSDRHSLDFRHYIRKSGSATIPLTFNLRPRDDEAWNLKEHGDGMAEIQLSTTHEKVLAQVDCQHRLGHVGDLDVSLPFMIFIGLSETDELRIFNVINDKAKGLSGSLLDFHESRLARDLATERPELLIALQLNENESSPWYKQLDLGGKATSGMKRRASLRTMQKAVKRFLNSTSILDELAPQEVAEIVASFWSAVAFVWHDAWSDPRRHLTTKGIGVYSLMGLLADLWMETVRLGLPPGQQTFSSLLSDFAPGFNWANKGPLRGLGGEAGAAEALEILRRTRRAARLSA